MYVCTVCMYCWLVFFRFFFPSFFWLFSLLWAFCATTVLPFIRRSQGSTLGFRPFPSRRRFASRKSIRSEIFSATVKALWSLHPHKCLVFENPRALRWKWAFSTANSTTASLCTPCDIVIGHDRGRGLGPRSNFTRPRVVQSINVHYLPHPLSELSSCCIVPINQWHSEVPQPEVNNGHDLNILRGFPHVLYTSTTASAAMLSKAKRPVEIDDESNPKRLKSGKGSSFV